jgi:hypothetical protein
MKLISLFKEISISLWHIRTMVAQDGCSEVDGDKKARRRQRENLAAPKSFLRQLTGQSSAAPRSA